MERKSPTRTEEQKTIRSLRDRLRQINAICRGEEKYASDLGRILTIERLSNPQVTLSRRELEVRKAAERRVSA